MGRHLLYRLGDPESVFLTDVDGSADRSLGDDFAMRVRQLPSRVRIRGQRCFRRLGSRRAHRRYNDDSQLPDLFAKSPPLSAGAVVKPASGRRVGHLSPPTSPDTTSTDVTGYQEPTGGLLDGVVPCGPRVARRTSLFGRCSRTRDAGLRSCRFRRSGVGITLEAYATLSHRTRIARTAPSDARRRPAR